MHRSTASIGWAYDPGASASPQVTVHMAESIRNVFKGRVLTLNLEQVELPNGRVAELEIAHHPGGAAIVALDADGRVVEVLHDADGLPFATVTTAEVIGGRLWLGSLAETAFAWLPAP